jgi:hypothetical protein
MVAEYAGRGRSKQRAGRNQKLETGNWKSVGGEATPIQVSRFEFPVSKGAVS